MTRILLRAKKHPFEVLTPEQALERNVIGTNSGNLIFIQSAYKLLSAAGTEIDVHGRLPDPRDADRINERYDAYVVPLANAFRPEFEFHLSRLTSLVRRLRIPVVVLGVGIQAGVDGGDERLRPMQETVKAFVGAVLERSPSIGVRGEITQAYLESVGFRDVEVIGCPSMFMYGPEIGVAKAADRLHPATRIAVNATPGVPGMAELLAGHAHRYAHMTYVLQDLETLAFLLFGEAAGLPVTPGERRLDTTGHLFGENRVRLFIDPLPWISFLRDVEFTFGTRIHGNITALLAGRAAYVLAHDSRSLELARYFSIPHRIVRHGDAVPDAAELHAEADYGRLNAEHRQRFDRLVAFVAGHGLRHIYADGDPAAFEARLRSTPYPDGVDAATAANRPPALRLARLARYRLRRSASQVRQAVRRQAAARPGTSGARR